MWGWASVLWSYVRSRSLDCELHTSCDAFFPNPLQLGRVVREGWNGYFLGSEKSPAGLALVTYCLLRADLVEKKRILRHTVAQNDGFSSLFTKGPIFTLRTSLSFWSKTLKHAETPVCLGPPGLLLSQTVHTGQVRFGFSCPDTVPWRLPCRFLLHWV